LSPTLSNSNWWLYRGKIQDLLLHLKESLELVHELKAAIVAKHTTFDEECGKIADNSTTEQRVKFLLWIKNNEEALAKVFLYVVSIDHTLTRCIIDFP
jgi:hypothetical protein